MPFNFSWLVSGHLAGMGRPGCALEFSGEMLPHEQRFLSWLNSSRSLAANREKLADDIGLSQIDVDRRMPAMYRKFRETWGILASVREGFGDGGAEVDRFVRSENLGLEDLAFVKSQGIRHLVTLTERPLPETWIEEADVESLHLPVPNGGVPTRDQVDRFNVHVDDLLAANLPVLAHCLGGFGRTGTFLATYLVHCGATAEEAMTEVRRSRPASIENEDQEMAVKAFEEGAL